MSLQKNVFSRVAPELKITTENPNVSHWSLDNGYETTTAIENEYPIRVFTSKSIYLLCSIRLFDKDVGSHCEWGAGFTLGFTVPGDTVKIVDHIYIEMNQVINVLIKPKIIITSEKLRNYSPKQRRCFFNSERRLRFFEFYTQINCENECLANFTQHECGCVKYSMPSKHNTIF